MIVNGRITLKKTFNKNVILRSMTLPKPECAAEYHHLEIGMWVGYVYIKHYQGQKVKAQGHNDTRMVEKRHGRKNIIP